jgi:hypothetical protein
MIKQFMCALATTAIVCALSGGVNADPNVHRPSLSDARQRIHDATRQRAQERREYRDEMRMAQREHSDAMRLHGHARAVAMRHARRDIHAVSHERAKAIDRTRREWHSGVHERNMYRRDEANKRHWDKVEDRRHHTF